MANRYIMHLQKKKGQVNLKIQWKKKPQSTQKPNPKYANAALVEGPSIMEPITYEEARQKKTWKKAMEEEMRALIQNETRELVPKSKDAKPISCK